MLKNFTPFANFQLASITQTATANRYYFPDLPNLREVFTTAISVYPTQISSTDNNSFTAAAIDNAYVTFNVNGEEYIQRLELFRLVNMATTDRFSFEGLFTVDYLKIDYSKSYVELAPGTAIAFPSCFQFGIYYDKNPKVKK
jgi:hypothetical protein